jgi:hypothetical protein
LNCEDTRKADVAYAVVRKLKYWLVLKNCHSLSRIPAPDRLGGAERLGGRIPVSSFRTTDVFSMPAFMTNRADAPRTAAPLLVPTEPADSEYTGRKKYGLWETLYSS